MNATPTLDADTAGIWGSAVWGSDRWGELDIVSALQTHPSGGFPIGLGDWRLSLEILAPGKGSARWGTAVWGADTWPGGDDGSGVRWHDLSRYVRGVSWARGSLSVGTRPENGVMEVTLDNAGFRFSPWNAVTSWNGTVITDPDGNIVPSSFAPGTIVRLSTFTPSGQCDPVTDPDTLDPSSPRSWVPLFAGIVSSWSDMVVEGGADSFVTVFVEETLSAIAQTITPPVEPVGAGELALPRLTRLLEASRWRFGPIIDRYLEPLPLTELQLQATAMEFNRIEECYLTADSVGAVFRSDRSGLPTIYNRYGLGDSTGIRSGPDHAAITSLAATGSLGDTAGWSATVSSVYNDANDRALEIVRGASSGSVTPNPATTGPAQPGDRFTFTPSNDPDTIYWFEVDPDSTVVWVEVWPGWVSNRDTAGIRHISTPGLVVPYVADSVTTLNDDEVILNTVTLGNTGGASVTRSVDESVELYDVRAIMNDDLMGTSEALLELLIDNELTARAMLALRLETLQLHSRHYGAMSALIGIDVDDELPVQLAPLIPGYSFTVPDAQILGMSHTIEPVGAGVVWVGDYQLGLQSPLKVKANEL